MMHSHPKKSVSLNVRDKENCILIEGDEDVFATTSTHNMNATKEKFIVITDEESSITFLNVTSSKTQTKSASSGLHEQKLKNIKLSQNSVKSNEDSGILSVFDRLL